MSHDIPAAHSMDSTWFAVDEDGHIAVFDTGEGGAIPDGGFPAGGEAGGNDPLEESDLFAALVLLRALEEPELRAALPEDPEEAARVLGEAYWDAWEEGAGLLGAVGAFRFSADYGGVPYERENAVGTPVRVDQLPQPLRGRLEDAKLPVRFGQIRMLAPGEYTSVQSWSGRWVDTAGQEHAADGPATGHPADADDGMRPDDDYGEDLPIDQLIARVTEMVALGREEIERRAAYEAERKQGGLFGWLKSLLGG